MSAGHVRWVWNQARHAGPRGRSVGRQAVCLVVFLVPSLASGGQGRVVFRQRGGSFLVRSRSFNTGVNGETRPVWTRKHDEYWCKDGRGHLCPELEKPVRGWESLPQAQTRVTTDESHDKGVRASLDVLMTLAVKNLLGEACRNKVKTMPRKEQHVGKYVARVNWACAVLLRLFSCSAPKM